MKLNYDSMPSRDFETNKRPRADGEIINGVFYRNKIIKARGFITKTTETLLNEEIDDMKKYLKASEANLDIKVNGEIRRAVATLVNTDAIFDREHWQLTYIPFNLQFKTVEPFMKDINYTSQSLLTHTTLTFNEDVENTGTVFSRPVIILNFSAANGVTAINI